MINEDICILADKAYKGFHKIHFMSLIPVKASKDNNMTNIDNDFNVSLAKAKIFIEHINRYIKRFRIPASRYRNKRRQFAFRVSLICAIYKFPHNQ